MSLKQCVFQDDPQIFDIWEQNSQVEKIHDLMDGLELLVKEEDLDRAEGEMIDQGENTFEEQEDKNQAQNTNI